jgi:hypothetical protein
MKTFLISIVCLALTLTAYSQTGSVTSAKSKTKQITYKRNVNTNVVRLLPDLQISGQEFSDQNGNNMIDADENASIKFKLQNAGEGEAQQVNIKLTLLNGPVQGLNFSQIQPVGVVYPTQTKEITIPLTGKLDLVNSSARFKIEVTEKNGLDAYPLTMEITTKQFSKPEVVVADAVFSTEDGGRIKLNSPINLKVLVQNIGEGEAKDVNAEFFLENANCIMLDPTNKFEVGDLKVGETKELNFIFTATRNYAFDQIPVIVALSENYGKYAEKKSVSVGLEQNLVGNNEVVIKGIDTKNTSVERASLTAEVDKNIPVNPVKYPGRIALIIGNENYSNQQRDLNTEANVKFARNDAQVFSEYARKTLGVADDNLFISLDATAGEMQQKIELVSKLASKMGADAEVIFYYAGHGLPDEITKTPYLIPVDVSGTNLSAAIKLSDIYKKLGESGSRKVTVFLDACFSGGGRESGLLAARSVKIKPKEESISGNMVVFTASSGEQSALPYNEKQHGMFTYFLLKKLQDSGGNVSYPELGDYISKNVSIESLRINNKEQDPVINISPVVESTWKNWKIN